MNCDHEWSGIYSTFVRDKEGVTVAWKDYRSCKKCGFKERLTE